MLVVLMMTTAMAMAMAVVAISTENLSTILDKS